jgi:hypothetical protein
MPLGRRRRPFSHPDWLFEIKWDGFRSLAQIEDGQCRLISRNGNEFKSFSVLNDVIADEIKTRSAVLDGEIVCLDDGGKPQFRDLLFRRGEPRLYNRFGSLRPPFAVDVRGTRVTTERSMGNGLWVPLPRPLIERGGGPARRASDGLAPRSPPARRRACELSKSTSGSARPAVQPFLRSR